VTGVLTTDIATNGEARYTPGEFVEAIGTVVVGAEVEGRIRDLLSFSAASGFPTAPRLVKWNRLPNGPTTERGLAERLPNYDRSQSTVVLAGMGVGKTVASQMAFAEEASRLASARVLRFEARLLTEDDLAAVLRAACLLAGVGPTWIAVDGLD